MQDTSLEVKRNWESGKNSQKKPIAALLFMQMCPLVTPCNKFAGDIFIAVTTRVLKHL